LFQLLERLGTLVAGFERAIAETDLKLDLFAALF
jgi:hypothetical protein